MKPHESTDDYLKRVREVAKVAMLRLHSLGLAMVDTGDFMDRETACRVHVNHLRCMLKSAIRESGLDTECLPVGDVVDNAISVTRKALVEKILANHEKVVILNVGEKYL